MIYNGYVKTTKWQSLPRELRDDVGYRQFHFSGSVYHAPECTCTMDDYFEIVHCNCGLEHLLDKLDEHGYTDVELERLFPDGYIY